MKRGRTDVRAGIVTRGPLTRLLIGLHDRRRVERTIGGEGLGAGSRLSPRIALQRVTEGLTRGRTISAKARRPGASNTEPPLSPNAAKTATDLPEVYLLDSEEAAPAMQ